MEISCPSCRKRNVDSSECCRCGCELEMLLKIAEAAQAELIRGYECLQRDQSAQAMEHALRSRWLKQSPNSAKLAFLASIGEEKFEQALFWSQCLEE